MSAWIAWAQIESLASIALPAESATAYGHVGARRGAAAAVLARIRIALIASERGEVGTHHHGELLIGQVLRVAVERYVAGHALAKVLVGQKVGRVKAEHAVHGILVAQRVARVVVERERDCFACGWGRV